jgi:hypothetical protein
MCRKIKIALVISSVALLSACGGGGGGSGSGGSDVPGPAKNAAPIAIAGQAQTVKVGAVITLDASASTDPEKAALKYTWTLTTKPTDSAVYFSDAGLVKATLSNTMAGTYVATLVVNDGASDSAASSVSITVMPLIGAEVAPPRAPVQAEIDYLIKTATDNIPLWVKSPSTFKIVGTPSWDYYDSIGKPAEGSVTVNFDSQNGFGALVRTRAICPTNWDNRGFWRNTMQNSLALCVFY